MEHFIFQLRNPLFVEVDGGDVVFKDTVVGRIGKFEIAQVVLVLLGPVGFAVVVVAQAAEHGEQAGFGAALIIDRISASTTQVADRFIHGIRDIDRDEVVGAEVFGKFHGVAFVGFDAVSGLGGYKGRGDPEPSASGLIGNDNTRIR